MTITQILANEDTSPTEKLRQVSQVVDKIREIYGNTAYEIASVEIPTCDGFKPLAMLGDDTRVGLVKKVIADITNKAHEDCLENEGIVFDRRIEEYIATNPVLTNLEDKLDSKYI